MENQSTTVVYSWCSHKGNHYQGIPWDHAWDCSSLRGCFELGPLFFQHSKLGAIRQKPEGSPSQKHLKRSKKWWEKHGRNTGEEQRSCVSDKRTCKNIFLDLFGVMCGSSDSWGDPTHLHKVDHFARLHEWGNYSIVRTYHFFCWLHYSHIISPWLLATSLILRNSVNVGGHILLLDIWVAVHDASVCSILQCHSGNPSSSGYIREGNHATLQPYVMVIYIYDIIGWYDTMHPMISYIPMIEPSDIIGIHWMWYL
jgi:hypothetical protein